MTMFHPGQPVEFWSGAGGGGWKPGVVAEVFGPYAAFGVSGRNVRIEVGEGVWIVRPTKKCRAAETETCEDEMNGTDRPLVLYHAACADGFCAAWVAHKVMPDAEYVAVQYGQDPPAAANDKDRTLFILDFSYPGDVMFRLAAMRHKEMIVLDHHKTAEAALNGLELELLSNNCGDALRTHFDMSKSGGRLAWEHFFPSKPSPWLVDYTEDRDLWRWKLFGSKEVSATLASYPRDFALWDSFDKAGLDCRNRMEGEGVGILRYQSQQVESQAANASEIELDGHKVLAVNATMLISEIAGKLAEDRPFGASFFTRADGKQVWSLRSRDGGIDVSEVAKGYGGGGHRNAAGFVAGVPLMGG